MFDVEFVDGALDHAPVAQIDASLGQSVTTCAPGLNSFRHRRRHEKWVWELPRLDDRADPGVEGEPQPPAHHYASSHGPWRPT
jgi:hypothetical protein